MLDSSPVALPPVHRMLKRSASVASLPTPPRTRHKRKSVESRKEADLERSSSASESDGYQLDLKNCQSSQQQHKRPFMGAQATTEDEEEVFWMGDGTRGFLGFKSKSDTDLLERRDELLPQSSPESEKNYLFNAPSILNCRGTALVSPPPSSRKVAILKLPVTPKKRLPTFLESALDTPRPIRDSPNNPFLDTPSFDTDNGVTPDSSPIQPRTPQKERPTITYVFRGVRGTFPNPLYDHKNKRPRSPSAKSLLPIEHPEFSPSAHVMPRLLFPEALPLRKRKQMGKEKKKEIAKQMTPLEKERTKNIRNPGTDKRAHGRKKSNYVTQTVDHKNKASSSKILASDSHKIGIAKGVERIMMKREF